MYGRQSYGSEWMGSWGNTYTSDVDFAAIQLERYVVVDSVVHEGLKSVNDCLLSSHGMPVGNNQVLKELLNDALKTKYLEETSECLNIYVQSSSSWLVGWELAMSKPPRKKESVIFGRLSKYYRYVTDCVINCLVI
jgi:hypothetical protein